MNAPVLRPETLCQVGFVVHDVAATARKYAEAFGFPVPPIIETPGFDKARTTVNGEPSEATAKLAFFQTGQLVIELIQPDETPSVWRDFLETNGEGVHHIAFRVADTKAAEAGLAGQGFPTLQQGLFVDGSGMYTYLDTAPQLGVMIELLETFRKS
ncbi:VOC family protein [Labrys wisconsinensis]|uniref:Catechol 2,3-dioxygenase-like lactoylglutathione lyase family enzyme n=1 Tax=Labrys wisconsinensis TaxID=425677 RepID=A0ABU0JMW9_9HYPH|nr:VOC family protein [Labrys wisconsinensis]MDQ0474748.1 catechol 2,3-dioxygenase-like lactoylglutathione lyase family enzyme [Labrys wisconsinensis]